MKINFSHSMVSDARDVIEAECQKYLAVNVARLAEEIQARNVEDNVALEDIKVLIRKIAENLGAPMLLHVVRAKKMNGYYSSIGDSNTTAETLRDDTAWWHN